MKFYYFLTITIALLFSRPATAQEAGNKASDPRYVWVDEAGEGRFQVACFRNEINLPAIPQRATIHLFADSRYHLSVNGHFVNFGPARFYPEHPQYDTYDLKPYLQTGKNVIAVKVISNGTASFQLRRNLPAFIAWGKWTAPSGETIDLVTPGHWKARKMNGYDEDAPRATFALGPIEVYDARKDTELQGWEQPEYRGDWPAATVLSRQDAWGMLKPRSIPQLTQEEYRPRQLLGQYTWQEEETLYSFQRTDGDKSWDEFRESLPYLGYTYIYSPKDQSVTAGMVRGDFFLNGEGPLESHQPENALPPRREMMLDLKKGWNYLLVKESSFYSRRAFVLTLPKNVDLQLSPDKKMDDPHFFKTAGPVRGEGAAKMADLDWKIVEPAIAKEMEFVWEDVSMGDHSGNPTLDMAFRYFGEKMDVPAWQIDQVEMPGERGASLVYDFRYKKLGRVVVEYDAPAGTVIDLAFTEDLWGDQPNVSKRYGLTLSTRHITAGGEGRIETLKPYGLRYLQVNTLPNNGKVLIKKVRVINQVYPFEKIGSFQCSDPVMNDIWELGWRTLEVCAEDSYTDTPFRERGLYAGDMLPQMGITLAGSPDLRLVRRSLALFQDMYIDQFNPGAEKHPDEIGLLEDYPLLTLEALKWYVDWTGERSFADSLYPAYDRLIETALHRRGEDGLVKNDQVFIEWTQLEKRDVKNTAYQAILARSCEIMALLGEQLGEGERAAYYRSQKTELEKNIRESLWNEEKQAFTDGLKDNQQIDHYYSISSVWPYLAGMTTAEQNKKIVDHIASELKDIGTESRNKKATPYGSFYLFAVLYEMGRPEIVEQFIREQWSPMVYRHNDTAWENFDDQNIGTLSHAWSGAPTYYLTTRVLGVDLGWPRTIDPDQLVIAPHSATINWARGKVPHPKGVISVSWEVRGNHLWLACEVPEGVEYEVKPKGRLGELVLWVNGERR